MKALMIIIPAAIAIFVIMLPDIFPQCYVCGEKKVRPLFRIHRIVSLKPGYSSAKSVCEKCCRKFDIESTSDMERVRRIKRKAMLEFLARPR